MANQDSYGKFLTQVEEWVYEGEDYLEIKKKLANSSLSAADQLKLLSRADDFIVQREHYDNQRNSAIIQIILGGTIGLVGFMFWYFGVNTGEGTGKRAISIIIMGIGLLLAKKGYDKYRQPPRPVAVMQDKKNIFDRYRTKEH